MDSITRGEIKAFLLSKVKSYSGSHVNNMRTVLSGVFETAMDYDKTIQVNPTINTRGLISRKTEKNVDALTEPELNILLKTFKTHYPMDYPLMLTLARTGMRDGEAFALMWDDIDFASRKIHIQRTHDLGGGLCLPKKDKTRIIDMSLELTQTLREHKRILTEMTLKRGLGKLPNFVFITSDGERLSIRSWTHQKFYKALEKAGIRKIRIHDIRHSYASILLQKGVPLTYVQKQLGHSSPRITLDVYAHYLPSEENGRAVDCLDAPTRTPGAPYPPQKVMNSGQCTHPPTVPR
jgi:integrase